MATTIIRTVEEMRQTVRRWRCKDGSIAVVPTMGALHEGHLSLVRVALSHADWVVVTVFVNPTQFNNAEDLIAYPRTEESDLAKLTTVGAHVLYAPSVDVVYPKGFATTVHVGNVSHGLCGAHRPGHFDGVATVVTKLFLQIGADIALFGEKDFQQLHVVRRLARDLDIPIQIIPCATIREPDGLAMSSRNRRLSTPERQIASHLPAVLFHAAEQLRQSLPTHEVIAEAKRRLEEAGFDGIDYVDLRSETDLSPLDTLDRPARLLAAASLPSARLIDNVRVAPPAWKQRI
ncbi:pantoate--beta-alanine ligase [Rhizobium binae]|uniref:pantoate--beta-alanine ligase n=1 Tax=Rhizobium binae TaxID=1138190 RepID=UPI001C833537|nr:pantoate--beta-alanine ligase [Rhizobium binae]MBX4962636.1 pantoate--beta-alanine ligase [Rhizobium binae]